MIAADKNLPSVFVNNESLKDHINNALVGYNQEFESKDDMAGYLNTLLEALISINSGTAYSENAYYYVFDAQSIIQKFCQAQNIDESTITYIRNHYFIEDFETLKIVAEDEGYSIYY